GCSGAFAWPKSAGRGGRARARPRTGQTEEFTKCRATKALVAPLRNLLPTTLSVEDEGVDDVICLPALVFERYALLEHLAHVGYPYLFGRRGLHEKHCISHLGV